MAVTTIPINRAPVLTLWAAVVAERLGHSPEEALSLAKAVAGLNAQAKGRLLGIFHPKEGPDGEPRPKSGLGEEFWVDLLGRPVPAVRTPAGIRAVVKDDPIEPAAVDAYLRRAFGENLPAAREALAALAGTFPPEELAEMAYPLYEKFRPKIASGQGGWGQKGTLDLGKIRGLAR